MSDTTSNYRRDIWMWLFLNEYRDAKFHCVGCGGISMRQMVARHLQENPGHKKDILARRDWFMVPEGELAWITDEKRQYEWLFERLQRMTGENLAPNFPNLQGRNLLIAMLDIWDSPLKEKIVDIKGIKEHWIYHKNGDIKFKWFADASEGERRCRFASDWLQKNDRYLARSMGVFENYAELLICFDKKNLNSAELKLLLMNIRRSWNRQSSRERQVGKKQYNFVLSNKVVECLDKLAEDHALRRAQVLELLIKKEFENGAYLAGWEKRFE
ncbi:hypothetical protein [Microvirgula aerodenitrificans]|uniref:hypothetical protein n=1 Tax=Microvirgula aerodenitrificans TaxID=57480 RepID=UPI0012EBF81F|nr:hypothetical protein [Microvirgula aerodenitrificans]